MEDILLKAMQKDQAVSRLGVLRIKDDEIVNFMSSLEPKLCEHPFGKMYLMDTDDKEAVREFEKQYNALVYLVIRNVMEDGNMLDSYLYVSEHKDEWCDDIIDCANMIPVAYVRNYRHPELSEFGSIVLSRTENGGVIRVG